jgi:hypothetical protein
MGKVTIEIDSRWVKVVRSPIYWIVSALTGVSVTFAPLFLFWCGKGMFRDSEWIVAPSCFAVILLVGLFYMSLGSAVIGEIRKKKTTASDR